MANPRRSDIATIEDADWSFYVPDVAGQIRKLAESGSREYPHLDADDLEQDLALWIAVRPEQQGSMSYIVQQCRHMIRQWGQVARTRAGREVPYEPPREEDDV